MPIVSVSTTKKNEKGSEKDVKFNGENEMIWKIQYWKNSGFHEEGHLIEEISLEPSPNGYSLYNFIFFGFSTTILG